MAENKRQRGPDVPKPESASKPAKRAYEEHERDRASEADRSDRNAERPRRDDPFRDDRGQASEGGGKGGQH